MTQLCLSCKQNSSNNFHLKCLNSRNLNASQDFLKKYIITGKYNRRLPPRDERGTMRLSSTQLKTGVCTRARKVSERSRQPLPVTADIVAGIHRAARRLVRKFLREHRGPGSETARQDCVGKVLNTGDTWKDSRILRPQTDGRLRQIIIVHCFQHTGLTPG